MGLLDKLFGKKGDEGEKLSSHQARYEHHNPIDFGAWGEGEEEPPLDLEFKVDAISPAEQIVEPVVDPVQQQSPKEAACQAAEGEVLTIVLTVMANDGDHFEGGDLQRAFNACGLHIGKDGLFHRYPEQGGEAPLFSISNALNPGIFDPQQMINLQTRGLVLFAQLPSTHASKVCFGALVETANTLALGLGGQVMDGERRPISNHVLQRMQEQVLEFDYCRELERRKAEQQDRTW